MDTHSIIENYKHTLGSFGTSQRANKASHAVQILEREDLAGYLGKRMAQTCSNGRTFCPGRGMDKIPELIIPEREENIREVADFGYAPQFSPDKGPGDEEEKKRAELEERREREKEFAIFNARPSEMSKTAPTEEEIHDFCAKVLATKSHRIPKESLIVALLYIEKMMMKSGFLLNGCNWRRIVLISLVLAAKVWSDEPLGNEDFASEVATADDINELERVFLGLVEYELHVNGAEYAKYYFVLKAFAATVATRDDILDIKPVSMRRVMELKEKASRIGLMQSDVLAKTK